MFDRIIEVLGRIPAGDFLAILSPLVGIYEPLRHFQVNAEAAVQASNAPAFTFNDIPIFELCVTLECYYLTLGNIVEYISYVLCAIGLIHAIYTARKK